MKNEIFYPVGYNIPNKNLLKSMKYPWYRKRLGSEEYYGKTDGKYAILALRRTLLC